MTKDDDRTAADARPRKLETFAVGRLLFASITPEQRAALVAHAKRTLRLLERPN